jgi:hypothetical protein
VDNFNALGLVGTWQGCTGLTSFPALNFDNGTIFEATWFNCTNLADFPANMFDNCTATNFNLAWRGCALSSQSVDNILVSLDTAGQSNGTVLIDQGTNSYPGAAGLAAKASLESKGWTVNTVPAPPPSSWFESFEDWRYNHDSAGFWPLT